MLQVKIPQSSCTHTPTGKKVNWVKRRLKTPKIIHTEDYGDLEEWYEYGWDKRFKSIEVKKWDEVYYLPVSGIEDGQ